MSSQHYWFCTTRYNGSIWLGHWLHCIASKRQRDVNTTDWPVARWHGVIMSHHLISIKSRFLPFKSDKGISWKQKGDAVTLILGSCSWIITQNFLVDYKLLKLKQFIVINQNHFLSSELNSIVDLLYEKIGSISVTTVKKENPSLCN